MSDAQPTPDFPWQPVRPLQAWKAFWDLVGDRDDTRHVFEFIHAVNGKTSGPLFERFLASEFGHKVLEDETYIDRKLLDRAALEAAGPGTVASAYLAYLDAENLHPLGVHQAAIDAAPELHEQLLARYPEFMVMRRTLAITHDLFHILTGYGRDPLGEALLLEFSGVQSGNRGTRILGRMAGLRIRAEIPRWPVGRMMRNAYRMSRESADLTITDLTELLPLPLEAARAQLNLVPDPLYREVRDSWTGPEPVASKLAEEAKA